MEVHDLRHSISTAVSMLMCYNSCRLGLPEPLAQTSAHVVFPIVLGLLRHVLPGQLSCIQYPQLPSDLPPHEAQLFAWPVAQASPPVSLGTLQIRRQYPSVPSGSHPLPDHLLSSASQRTHRRQLPHHSDVSGQAAPLASCRPPSPKEC